MGRHQLNPTKSLYRPAGAAKHAAASRALDVPEGLEVANPKTSGLRRIPLTVALMTMGVGTVSVPSEAATGELDAEASLDAVRAASDVELIHPRVTVETSAAEPVVLSNEVVVKSGDTVGALAEARGVNVWDMLAANGLGPWDLIFPGQTLVYTGPSMMAAAPAPAAPAPAAPSAVVPAAAAPAPAAPASTRSWAIYQASVAQIGQYQDCVKMVADSLATVGIYWYKWPHEYLQIGQQIPMDQAVPGDLLYYVNGGAGVGHIAVYAGDGRAIHGGWNGNETREFSAYVGSGPIAIRLY